MTNVKSSSDTGWWLVVEKLKEPRSAVETLELLEAAVSAAEGDAAWSHSGIMELLRRAKEQARSGHAALATRSAIGLLGFHQTALKLKSSSNNATSDGESKSCCVGEIHVVSAFLLLFVRALIARKTSTRKILFITHAISSPEELLRLFFMVSARLSIQMPKRYPVAYLILLPLVRSHWKETSSRGV